MTTKEYIKIHNNLWKDAQGDDLPEIDKEVIALQGRKVVFAHRPLNIGMARTLTQVK